MVNTKSLVGVKPGYSGVVTGYQVDEFTHTGWKSILLLIGHTFTLDSAADHSINPFPA